MDWNNLAPSIGVAWTPSAEGGFSRTLTGEPGDFVGSRRLQPIRTRATA